MITPQSFPKAGAAITYAAPLSADRVPVGSLLFVKNGSGASINVTITTSGAVLETGDAYPNHVVAVGAGAELVIPITLNAYFPTDGTNNANVAFSATASVTVAAISRF
jgi:hypothetical protein